MKTLFVAAVHNITIPETLKSDIQFPYGLRLTNNWRVLRQLISPRLSGAIGGLETQALLNAPAVLYSFEDAVDLADHVAYLNRRLHQSRVLLTSLWYQRDNAVDYELGFAETPHRAEDSTISSNYIATKISKATGDYSAETFTCEELTDAADSMSALINSGENTAFSELSRIERALYFLQAARATNKPPFKVSYYCTCFEALFSTSATELTHKLGERVAAWTTTNPMDRLRIYREIKQAYQIRSKVVHGDKLGTSEIQKAAAAAVRCDRLLRTILVDIQSSAKLHDAFQSKPERLENLLMGMTFGMSATEALSLLVDDD